LVQEINPVGRVDYTYNDVGLRTAMTVAGETPVSYSYDAANRLLGVTQGTFSSSLFYDDAGRRTRLVLPNGINVLYFYDKASRLTNITYLAAVTNRIDYAYDSVGNRVLQSSALALYILPSAISTSSYNAANRLLSAISVVETNLYSYDNAGRLIAQTLNGQSRSYQYSFRGQMTSLTDTNGTTFTYEFDGDGNRISASVAGCLTARYVYDGPNVVLDLNASNQVVHAYVHGPGIDQPIERLTFIAGTVRERHVYHTDGLDSVVAMTDSTQAEVKSYTYEAFGRIRTESGNSHVINRYTFTAREALGDSLGLYYYRWRVMDPNVGRFTSEDPLGFVDDYNSFVYTSNRPTLAKDARGTSVWTCYLRAGCMADCALVAIYQDIVCEVQALICFMDCENFCEPLKSKCIQLCQDDRKTCHDDVNEDGRTCLDDCKAWYPCP
jgi:RHS repeat-associated protein